MPPPALSRRHLLQATGAAAVVTATGAGVLGAQSASAAVVPPVRADVGAAAFAFDLGQVRLTAGRFQDNENRTLLTVHFYGADITSVAPEKSDSSSEDVKLTKIELYTESMELEYPQQELE